MNKTRECLDQIQLMIDNINLQHEALIKILSNYDKKREKYLHDMEKPNLKVSASQGYKIYKEIESLQIERRNVKNELINLNSLRKNIKNFKNNMNEKLHKIEAKQSKATYKERCKHEVKTLDQVCEKTVNIKENFEQMMKKFKTGNYMKRKHKWG